MITHREQSIVIRLTMEEAAQLYDYLTITATGNDTSDDFAGKLAEEIDEEMEAAGEGVKNG